ncbi:hypothetical protein ACFFTN_06110 [Aminobacter aganoensis]|uniref:N-acetyltransferase domain-containing protein n=1 Tax=Aminobacter aganoensis TaxID=83264 RepID=A0A7X0KJB0_9HYPH|nr:hypothetical protein [Aminobacter aganoensis]MBB6353086.1 hypothetical protein [Aminobacter aganoensis]
MPEIRPLRADDLPVVADMFQRVLRKRRSPAPATLASYLQRLYLDSTDGSAGSPSLVHVAENGRVSGFVGVTSLPMRFGETRLNASICGSLMVDEDQRNDLSGARLLKAFLAGPQDISFSETASDVTANMWTTLRGTILPQHSLDWIKVIKPASFTIAGAKVRVPMARFAAPLARAADAGLRLRRSGEFSRWFGARDAAATLGRYTVADIDQDGFARLLGNFTSRFAVHPEWNDALLARIMADASAKQDFGAPFRCRVSSRTGAVIGAFMYFGRAGEIGHVLQVLALPGQAGAVIDCLIAHAATTGLAAVRGRTQPALLEAMLGRQIIFINVNSTVVHARDPELVRQFQAGNGFFNGLVGEHWSRIFGDRFD